MLTYYGKKEEKLDQCIKLYHPTCLTSFLAAFKYLTQHTHYVSSVYTPSLRKTLRRKIACVCSVIDIVFPYPQLVNFRMQTHRYREGSLYLTDGTDGRRCPPSLCSSPAWYAPEPSCYEGFCLFSIAADLRRGLGKEVYRSRVLNLQCMCLACWGQGFFQMCLEKRHSESADGLLFPTRPCVVMR